LEKNAYRYHSKLLNLKHTHTHTHTHTYTQLMEPTGYWCGSLSNV